MSNDLGVVGKVVTNRILFPIMIHGLNERFAHVGTLLQRVRPFPYFLEAHDDLILADLTMENRQIAHVTALVAQTKTSADDSPQLPSSGSTSSNSRHSDHDSNNWVDGHGGGGVYKSSGAPQLKAGDA